MGNPDRAGSEPTDLPDVGVVGQRLEGPGEGLRPLPHTGQGVPLLHQPEVGEGRRAGQGVAGVGVAVEEGLELLVLAEEGVEDLLRGQGGRQGQVAAREPTRIRPAPTPPAAGCSDNAFAAPHPAPFARLARGVRPAGPSHRS